MSVYRNILLPKSDLANEVLR